MHKQKHLLLIAVSVYIVSITIASIIAWKLGEPLTQPYKLTSTYIRIVIVHDPPTIGTPIQRAKEKSGNVSTRVYQPPVARPPAQQPNPSYSGSFPRCYWEPGWFYGPHPGGFEYGTDFDCAYHTSLMALWGGKVLASYRTQWGSYDNTAGGLVVITAFVPGFGYQDTYYLHLDITFVKVGQRVDKGDIIGLSGGQVGYGNWPTSPWFTSGPHVEIGWDYPFALVHEHCCNSNPLWAIEDAR